MDRQRIEGGLKKTTGTIKEKAGQAVGDRHLETEGKAEKAEGHIRSGVGRGDGRCAGSGQQRKIINLNSAVAGSLPARRCCCSTQNR
jgi:uncharacterized protein YjbJ (UPF0337 family)